MEPVPRVEFSTRGGVPVVFRRGGDDWPARTKPGETLMRHRTVRCKLPPRRLAAALPSRFADRVVRRRNNKLRLALRAERRTFPCWTLPGRRTQVSIDPRVLCVRYAVRHRRRRCRSPRWPRGIRVSQRRGRETGHLAAAGVEVPRRRAGAGAGCGGEPEALAARDVYGQVLGASWRSSRRRTDPTIRIKPKSVRCCWTRWASRTVCCRWWYAGAAGEDGDHQAEHGDDRFRP